MDKSQSHSQKSIDNPFSQMDCIHSYELLDVAPFGIMMVNMDYKILAFNQAASDVFGYKSSEIVGRSLDLLIPKSKHEKHKKHVDTFAKSGERKIMGKGRHIQAVHKSGDLIDVEIGISVLGHGPHKTFFCMIRDMQAQRKYEEKLVYKATHDPLTGVFNRLFFDEHILECCKEAKRYHNPFSILYIDLDDFKQINDTMGHEVGDKVLRIFANQIKSTLRDTDVVARLGGDEFVIILKNLNDKKQILNIIKKVKQSFKEPYLIYSHKIKISLSIGWAIFGEQGSTPQNLIQHADQKMYDDKKHKNDK